MAFQNPIMAYTAKTEVEAYLVCDILRNEGIGATVVEDVSQAGVWIGGFVGAIYKPQVWIERTDAERAGALVHEYERRAAERWAAERAPLSEERVAVTCEKCGRPAEFPAAQRGTVQNCPHCRAYVDVGDDVGFEGWDEVPRDED